MMIYYMKIINGHFTDVYIWNNMYTKKHYINTLNFYLLFLYNSAENSGWHINAFMLQKII